MSGTAPDDPLAAQAETIAFLGAPATHRAGVASVERVETHGALVFLAGDDVFKIKKAVRFPYMDFSTLELRRTACCRELEINQPHAPDIYLGLVEITRGADGSLTLDGEGETVEWAIHMRRFPTDALLSRMVERGEFTAMMARDAADAVFDYHQSAAVASSERPAEQMRALASDVEEAMRAPKLAFDSRKVIAFAEGCSRVIDTTAPLLARRAGAGLIRRCHGDLHLANIVMWKGRPTLFDAIEFDEALATIDTLYDLAFLLMDLDVRGERAKANVVLNRYLWRSQNTLDIEGLAALPLFMALRAGIRAMVTSQREAQKSGHPQRPDHGPATSATGLLDSAVRYLAPPPPRLIAVGGMSGTGKSTLAAALAPLVGAAPGAIHLRSDLERKAMFGKGETERLAPATYTENSSRSVYERLIAKARLGLAAGHGVIVDAAYLREEERRGIRAVAAAFNAPFQGLWLTAPPGKLKARVDGRTGDASDATSEVVQLQLGFELGTIDWTKVDASGTPDTVLSDARKALAIDS